MTNGDFDFSKTPQKVYVDTAHMKIINGLQHITFQSGEDLATFVLPLPLSKMIARGLLKQVEEIEQKTGRKIDARLPDEPLLSPWSSGDGEGGQNELGSGDQGPEPNKW